MTRAADWQGRVGATWAAEWHRTERAFSGIASVLDRAVADRAPAYGHALDIGCGVGSTAIALSGARPALQVVGCDLSADLLDIARERGREHLPAARAVRFLHADALDAARAHAPVDMMVSRHGLMFFEEPVSALRDLAEATKPGAPLIFSCFAARADNGWTAHVDEALGLDPAPHDTAPGPYASADSDYVASVLAASGWRAEAPTRHTVPFVVGGGDTPVADALAFYRRIGPAAARLAAAEPATRLDMEARLADMVSRHLHDGRVTFDSAVWIWTAASGARA